MNRCMDSAARTLLDHGVDSIFGLTGNSNLTFVRELIENHGFSFYSSRHESTAVSMADGWARQTGRVGLCTVTRGPGVTNALTGLVEAVKSRTPLLFLPGEVPPQVIEHNQKLGHEALLSSVGVTTIVPRGPELFGADLGRALQRAMSTPGPVSVPLEAAVMSAAADGVPSSPAAVVSTIEGPASPTGAEDRVWQMFSDSERPVILAGRGARSERARQALMRLAEQTGAVLLTTAVVKGLFSGHPQYAGVCGGFSSEGAKELIDSADLVVAFGASLNVWTLGHGHRFPRATLVQIDTDPSALGRLAPIGLGIVGDCGAVATALVDAADMRGASGSDARVRSVSEMIAGDQFSASATPATYDDGLDPVAVMAELNRLLPTERSVVVDSGHFMGFPTTHLDVPDHHGFVFPQAFQAMGVGIGVAVGTAIARADRQTVLVCGDGGAMMMLGDIETGVRYGIPLLIVVMNDSAFGAEFHHLALRGDDTTLVTFPNREFAIIGQSLGAEGLTVTRMEDLGQIASWLRGEPSVPLVVDVRVTRQVRAPWFTEAWAGTS